MAAPRTVAGQAAISAMRPHLRRALAPTILAIEEQAAAPYEEGAGVTLIGEVEDVAVGTTKTVTLDLAAGKYVLLCNIVEEDEVHYRLGMRTAFEVTQ